MCGRFLSLNFLLCQRKQVVNAAFFYCERRHIFFSALRVQLNPERILFSRKKCWCVWVVTCKCNMIEQQFHLSHGPACFLALGHRATNCMWFVVNKQPFDLKESLMYPLCQFSEQGWKRQAARSDWVTTGLSSITDPFLWCWIIYGCPQHAKDKEPRALDHWNILKNGRQNISY